MNEVDKISKHPNLNFSWKDWIDLNGDWQFDFDKDFLNINTFIEMLQGIVQKLNNAQDALSQIGEILGLIHSSLPVQQPRLWRILTA